MTAVWWPRRSRGRRLFRDMLELMAGVFRKHFVLVLGSSMVCRMNKLIMLHHTPAIGYEVRYAVSVTEQHVSPIPCCHPQ